MSEKTFCQKNRALLAALLGIPLLMVAGGVFADAVMHPVAQADLVLDTSSNPSLKFWILTEQTYYGGLVIRPPSNLDRTTFDLISGCMDYPASRSPPRRPKWAIRSTWNQQIVVQGQALLGNPPPTECSTSGGNHLFSLGAFVIPRGRYQLELEFSDDLPSSAAFPVSLTISCCGKNTKMVGVAGNFPLFYAFVLIPASIIIFAILAIILLVRGGMHLHGRRVRPSN